MNKRFLLPALLLPALAFGQETYTIKGKVGSYNEPVKAFLSYVSEGKRVTDSAALKNGEFTFTGTVKSPTSAFLSLNYGPGTSRSVLRTENTNIYLEKGDILVQSKDSIRTATVKGGLNNKENNDLKKLMEDVNRRNNEIMTYFYSLTPEQQQDTAVRRPLVEKSRQIEKDQQGLLKQFLAEHNSSIVALDVLKQLAGAVPDYGETYPYFAKLSADVRNSEAGKTYGEYLDKVKAISIGAIAPEFTQNDPEGKPVSLSSFRGKYLLIDFWASWCGPCRAENPNVVKAYNAYKDKNFTILGVSLDQPNAKDKWLKAIADDNLTWTQVSDLEFWNNAVAKQYAVRSIPQNFLLDPQGKIVAKNLRGEDLEKKLAELLH